MTTRTERQQRLQGHIARIDRRIDQLQARSDQFVRWRVGIAVIGVVLTFLAFSQISLGAGYAGIVVTLVVFNIAAYFHRQVKRSITRHEHWRQMKAAHVARMALDWANLPESDASAPADHPFAHDLDIVGQYSIHRLLDTAVSREGSTRLLDWLLVTEPDAADIERRQGLVRELARLTNFRDRLTLHGWLAAGDPEQHITGDAILAWFRGQAANAPSVADLVLVSVLAAVNIALFVGEAADLVPRLWPYPFVVYVGYSLLRLRGLGDLFGQAMSLRGVLRNLHGVFEYLERYGYGASPKLKALCAPYLDPGQRPSAQLRRVGWVVSATSLRGNPVLWTAINAVLPWDMWFAYILSRQRANLAGKMPEWLDVWYELEALSALASFGWLNPEYTLPTVTEGSVFDGRGLGHPLIPHDDKACNDFRLSERGTLVIITGSNMAGKSSFLRTLGVNLALAYAGGPVNADHLEVSLFRLFSTIRINDSVTEGFSYFYAEVRRLKRLLTALEDDHPYPLFFLIDEIFKGTNNRERLIGSRAYIRTLAGRNGMGAVSTHDLELVQLADDIAQVSNMHFREEVVDGRMVFDYKLRTGPCPTTNALKIMALEGLPVDEAS